jgi:hypothetical protein
MAGRTWIFLGLLLAGSACRRGSGEVPLASDPILAPIWIEVRNNHAFPVEIFVTGSGINHRLGTVHPLMNATFELPAAMIGNGSVELVATASDSRSPGRTGPILLSPGAVVDYVIAQQLFNSTATIRQ